MRHILLLLLAVAFEGLACTSLVATGAATASGRPMLWKHRDTDAPSNFIARVEPREKGEIGFVGLFNAGDSTLSEAWTGMNDAGFAIMNTASYNLAPDTTDWKDREAVVMTMALRSCRSVDDFEKLLISLPKPMGVQANFGVIDSNGGAAYFETSDHSYRRFNVSDDPSGCLIRTNFSFTGTDEPRRGYVRYKNAEHLLQPSIMAGELTPELLTDTVSCSYWHSILGRNPLADGDSTVADLDFIPRRISTASIVIVGALPGENPKDVMRMRASLGYPPLSVASEATAGKIPSELQPDSTWDSPAARDANNLRDEIFIEKQYIDLEALRALLPGIIKKRNSN